MDAHADCLKVIAKAASPASAKRVQSALDKAYHKLNGFRKGVRYPAVLECTLEVIRAIQADLVYFQSILGEEAPAAFCTCLSACGCCQKTPQIDFKRVSKVVKRYPAMAEAVVPVILVRHKEALLRGASGVAHFDATKAGFVYDCLMAYPQHREKLFPIIYEVVNGLKRSEATIIDVLVRFVIQHPSYAKQGVNILNAAFYNPYPLVCILALDACATMLHANPQSGRHVDKGGLCQAFRDMQSVLAGPASAVKGLAQGTLKKIEACNAPFLREAWGRYLRAVSAN